MKSNNISGQTNTQILQNINTNINNSNNKNNTKESNRPNKHKKKFNNNILVCVLARCKVQGATTIRKIMSKQTIVKKQKRRTKPKS